MLTGALAMRQCVLVIGEPSSNIAGVYLRARGCCSLIELDEVFDRKSIKRDGAVRQLQSAEGSRMGGLFRL